MDNKVENRPNASEKCFYCGAERPNLALRCPNCGAGFDATPRERGAGFSCLLALAVLGLVLLGAFGGCMTFFGIAVLSDHLEQGRTFLLIGVGILTLTTLGGIGVYRFRKR